MKKLIAALLCTFYPILVHAGFLDKARDYINNEQPNQITIEYNSSRCNTGSPLVVTIINNHSRKSITYTTFSIDVKLRGYSNSRVDTYEYKSGGRIFKDRVFTARYGKHSSNKIIAPETQFAQCYKIPPLTSGPHHPRDLSFSVGYNEHSFKTPPSQ